MLLLAVISEASGRWKEGGRERAWRREVETGGEMDPGAFRTEQVEGMAVGRVRCGIQLLSGQRAGQDLLRDYSRLVR